MNGHSLAALLSSRGIAPQSVTAIRNVLAPALVCDDFAEIADLERAGILHLYDRMQEGPRIAHGVRVMSFVALPGGRARLTSFRRFLMRRPGIVPGDIVYDHDAAHLLHGFIGHAREPVFYDVEDDDRLADLIGTLTIEWPRPLAQDILPAADGRIAVVTCENRKDRTA